MSVFLLRRPHTYTFWAHEHHAVRFTIEDDADFMLEHVQAVPNRKCDCVVTILMTAKESSNRVTVSGFRIGKPCMVGPYKLSKGQTLECWFEVKYSHWWQKLFAVIFPYTVDVGLVGVKLIQADRMPVRGGAAYGPL